MRLHKRILEYIKQHQEKFEYVIFILILLWLVESQGMKTIWYFVAFLLGFTAYKVYKGWDRLILTFQHIESVIWGKPLENDFWKPGEFKERRKNTRFRLLKWKKKNSKKKT